MDGPTMPGGTGFQPQINQVGVPTTPDTQKARLEQIDNDLKTMMTEKALSKVGLSEKIDKSTFNQQISNYRTEVSNINDEATGEVKAKAGEMLGHIDKVLSPPTKGPSFLDRLSGGLSDSYAAMARVFKSISDYFFPKKGEYKLEKAPIESIASTKVDDSMDDFETIFGEETPIKENAAELKFSENIPESKISESETSDSITINDDSSDEEGNVSGEGIISDEEGNVSGESSDIGKR